MIKNTIYDFYIFGKLIFTKLRKFAWMLSTLTISLCLRYIFMKSSLWSGGNFLIFSMSTCIYGTHNEFSGFDRQNQAIKGEDWDPYFKKVNRLRRKVQIPKWTWYLYWFRVGPPVIKPPWDSGGLILVIYLRIIFRY